MSDNIAHAIAGGGAGILSMIETKRGQTSYLTAIRRIVEREGVSGLYAGINSALFGIALTNGVYYFWYEWTKAALERAALKANSVKRPLTTAESMLSGAIAGAATVLITNPIWVVNVREAAKKDSLEEKGAPTSTTAVGTRKVKGAPGFIGTLARIIKEEGIQSLWSGVGPALVLVINPIIQYTVFEQLKNAIETKRRLTSTDAFYLGALGKLIATASTYPYITVKARMQMRQSEHAHERYDNMFAGLQKIIDNEGIKGLYKGIGPKLLQSVFTAAFLFMFKESLFEITRSTINGVPRSPKIVSDAVASASA